MKSSELKSELIKFLILLLIVAILSFLTNTYIFQRTNVDGISMENTLHDKDSLFLDKISYRLSEPKRFDIVIFKPFEDEPKNFYIKRVIGLPNESVSIDSNGSIYINDKILDESYGKEEILDAGIAETKITLKENEYFVLGDNRNHSADSRDPRVGIVDSKQIIGKAFLRVFPFDKIEFLK